MICVIIIRLCFKEKDMIINVVLFAIGLVLLIKGGDWFVDGSTGIAKRFHIPEILIGATVVAIGTTLPEVMVSATASAQGTGSMAYGNAIGSIICNTALIAALTIAIRPAKAERKSLIFPVIIFFCAAIFYSLVAYFSPEGFTRVVGIVLLVGFVGYMVFQVIQAFKDMKPEEKTVEHVVDALDDEVDEDKQSTLGDFLGFIIVGAGLIAAQVFHIVNLVTKGEALGVLPEGASFGDILNTFYIVGIAGAILLVIGLVKAITSNKLGLLNSNIIYMIFGAIVIAVGATLLVDNGTVIATELGVPETVIALTFVALGTSLPELVTAITALAKGHSALSLGNIIGANIFNLVLVSGTAITISPFAVPAEKLIGGMNASLVVDIPVMLTAMLLLTVPTIIRGKLARWQGIALLGIYAAFCAFQFVM